MKRLLTPAVVVAFLGGIAVVLAWRRMMAAADAVLDELLPPRPR